MPTIFVRSPFSVAPRRRRRYAPRSAPAAATAYTLTAPDPASGPPGVASGNFTVTLNGLPTGTIVVTPSDSGDGGTFTPTTLSFSGSTVTLTFTYTPDDSGVKTISTSDNGGLSDPSSVTYTALRTTPATFHFATAGNDTTGDGSSGSPYQTISKANALMLDGVAGDSYLFNGGDTFTGNLEVTLSGTQSARVTIGSYGTGRPTFNSGAITGIMVQDVEFVTIENIIVDGDGTNEDFVSGDPDTGFDPLDAAAAIHVHDSRTSGDKYRSVWIDNCDLSGYDFGVFLTTPNFGQTVVGYADTRVTNCTIHDVRLMGIFTVGGAGGTGYGGAEGWSQSKLGCADTNQTFFGVYIADCEITDVSGEHLAGAAFIVMNATGVTILRVQCDNISFGDDALDHGPPGATWTSGSMQLEMCDQVLFEYCEAAGNNTNLGADGMGIDPDLGVTNCIVRNCYTHDNAGAGIAPGNLGTRIINCISRNDCRVNNYAAYWVWGTKCTIMNCTVYMDDLGAATPTLLRFDADANGQNRVLNCILYADGDIPIFKDQGGFTGDPADLLILGNLYYSTGTLDFDEGTHSTLSAWRASGFETLNGIVYGVVGDPLLNAPTTAGMVSPADLLASCEFFDIASGSPARGAALPLENVLLYYVGQDGLVNRGFHPPQTDFHGYPYRGALTAPDAGAVQYGAEDYDPKQGGAFGPLAAGIIRGLSL